LVLMTAGTTLTSGVEAIAEAEAAAGSSMNAKRMQ